MVEIVGHISRQIIIASLAINMTEQQFDCIAKLIRSRGSAAEQGARLVLVRGHTGRHAASLVDASPQSISNAVQRYEAAYELIESAWSDAGS